MYIHNFDRGENGPKNVGYFSNFLPKVNAHSKGENSSNLVTLRAMQSSGKMRFNSITPKSGLPNGIFSKQNPNLGKFWRA
jgi:hypothetical protein